MKGEAERATSKETKAFAQVRSIQNSKMLQKKKKRLLKCCLVDKKEEDLDVVGGLGLCWVGMTTWRTVSVVEAEFK